MAVTYEPIASQTLGADAATVTWSSIPSGFTDLIMIGAAHTKFTSAGNAVLWIRVGNGSVDTGSNYSYTYLTGNGSTASSARGSSATYIEAAPTYTTTASTTSTFYPFAFHFMSYSNTNVNKTILASGDVSAARLYRTVGLWRSTSAITNITIGTDATSIMAGSVLSLYGVRAA